MIATMFLIESLVSLNTPFFFKHSDLCKQDRMSTDAIEGLRDSQDLDDICPDI